MENPELTLQELKENMAFVGSVLNAEPVTNEAFSTFTKLLNVDYTNYVNKNDALAEEAAALLTLQNVQKDLHYLQQGGLKIGGRRAEYLYGNSRAA